MLRCRGCYAGHRAVGRAFSKFTSGTEASRAVRAGLDIGGRSGSNVPMVRTRLIAALLVTCGVLAPVSVSAAPSPETAYVDVAVATAWVSPGLNRPVDAAAVANPVDIRGWTASMTLAERSALVGKLETQALFGGQVK